MTWRTAACVLAVLAGGCSQAPLPTGPALPAEFFPLPAEARGGQILNKPLVSSWGKIYVGVSGTRPACIVEIDPATGRSAVVAWMKSNAIAGGIDRPGPGLLQEDPPDLTRPQPWPLAQERIQARLHEHAPGVIVGATNTAAADPDATRHYPGGHWFALDVRQKQLLDLGIPHIGEGIAAMAHAPGGSAYYMVTWPTGKFILARLARDGDLNKGHSASLFGLTGSALGLVSHYIEVLRPGWVCLPDGGTGQVALGLHWTAEQTGGRQRFQISYQVGLATPSMPDPKPPASLCQSNRYGNYWLDGAATADGQRLFAIARRSGRLLEMEPPAAQRSGRLIDHGDAAPWRPIGPGQNRTTPNVGLAVGADGYVYYTQDEFLMRLDPATGAKYLCGRLIERAGGQPLAGRWAASSPDGRLYFAAEHDGRQGVCWVDAKALPAPKLVARSPRRVQESTLRKMPAASTQPEAATQAEEEGITL